MDDLRLIKDKYGEEMMHFCRESFSTILETPGLLYSIISSKFSYSKFLYDDIKEEYELDDFVNYIYGFIKTKKAKITTDKTPQELFKEAGYDLYECHTEEDIQKFKKYYTKEEELCTFKGGRLNSCYVFFAVKENALELNRNDFINPKREDEYGTSVLSIQFSKSGTNIISIKNRYNHSVINPDSTFSNNLENIIPGLKNSFEATYNFDISYDSDSFYLDGYIWASDRKYYKYNYEINNIFYCPNNVLINKYEVKKYNPQEYLLTDYFLIDLKNKTIKLCDESIRDSFIDDLQDIKKIEITKEVNNKVINITKLNGTQIILKINKFNKIISYSNLEVRNIKDNFLRYNDSLLSINLPNTINIGNNFNSNNLLLEEMKLPSVKNIGHYFLKNNHELNVINLPNLENIGNSFLINNYKIINIYLKNVITIGDNFCVKDFELINIYLPKLVNIGDNFLYNSNILKSISLPSTKQIGDSFMCNNSSLEFILLPKVFFIGNNFLKYNEKIKEINFPNLKIIGDNYFGFNSGRKLTLNKR